MGRFESFLINENRSYLGHRVGDVLTALQDLEEDMPNLGSRHISKLAEGIVNQIRKIIHSNWEQKNQKYLRELQKIGVAIARTIEERGDLKEIIPGVTAALQDLSGKLGVKVNNLKAPEQMPGEDISGDDFALTGDGPAPKQQQASEQPPMPADQTPPPPVPGA